MKLKLLLLFVLLSSAGFAQSCIPKITVNDSIVSKTLRGFIIERINQFNDFKTKGFVAVHTDFYNSEATNDGLKMKLTIRDQYYEPDINNSRMIPSSYSYINDKLILFFDDNPLSNRLNTKCKKSFLKILAPFLEKKKHLKVKDAKGNIVINDKNFSDKTYNLHTGMALSVFANGTYKIERQNME